MSTRKSQPLDETQFSFSEQECYPDNASYLTRFVFYDLAGDRQNTDDDYQNTFLKTLSSWSLKLPSGVKKQQEEKEEEEKDNFSHINLGNSAYCITLMGKPQSVCFKAVRSSV